MDFLQNLWVDPTGKIFLITVGCTLFSYMIYGGYIHTFFGRRGSVPFGLADFSITDLISIFPAAIITIFSLILKAIKSTLKNFLIHFLAPIIVGTGIRSYISGSPLSPFLFDKILIEYLVQAGYVIWIFGYSLATFQSSKTPKRVFTSVEFLGIILLSVTLPSVGQSPTFTSIPLIQTSFVLDILFNILIPFTSIAGFFVFGIEVAQKAIKSNLLIRIDRLTLRQPILKEGMKKVTTSTETGNKPSFREIWLVQKNLPVDMEPDAYEWSATPDKNLYLIATFEKFVLLFAPIPGPEPEDGTTIMLNRDMILSMETGTTSPSKPQQG